VPHARYSDQLVQLPPAPLVWIELREFLLFLLQTPALLLPLPRRACVPLALLLPLVCSAFYSPIATALLITWLHTQLPSPAPAAATPTASTLPVVVLVGRGPAIAAVTTEAAAARLRQGEASAVYVSGDQRATAERLLQLGVAPERVAGDSCARTTWETPPAPAPGCSSTTPRQPCLSAPGPQRDPPRPAGSRHPAVWVAAAEVRPQATPPSSTPRWDHGGSPLACLERRDPAAPVPSTKLFWPWVMPTASTPSRCPSPARCSQRETGLGLQRPAQPACLGGPCGPFPARCLAPARPPGRLPQRPAHPA
jgi:hypothetical protein